MSTGNVISLLSLIVALQAFSFAFHVWIHQQYKKKQDAQIADIINNRFYIIEGYKAMNSVLIENSTTNQLYASLIMRLLEASEKKEICKRISTALKEYDYKQMKVMQEMALLGIDEVAKKSAARQLSEVFGDFGSYLLMKNIYNHNGKKDLVLSRYLEMLKQRLDNKLQDNKGY